MLKFWKPKGTVEARERLALAAKAEHVEPTGGPTGGAPTATAVSTEKLTVGRTVMAFLPYIVVIVVFSLAKLFTPLKTWLASTDIKFGWPGSDGNILTLAGKPSTATQYTLGYLSNAGTLLIISGVIVMIAYRIKPGLAVKEFGKTVYKLRFALLTVGSVLGLAYVMNLSGQTITIGQWLAAGTGAFFAFLSPILGWVGTAVTGSDTSANALFATLQQSAAEEAGLDPTLLVAANTSGGVVGKMISPQNLTIAATAVGLLGRESDILRRVLKWSIGLLLVMCVLVYLQSNVLAWMLP
jgi:lactate permease